MRCWTSSGGPKRIRSLRVEEQVTAPLCHSQGVVDAKDLVTREKVVVLKNVGPCYRVEFVDVTKSNTLPIFSLIFTKFGSVRFFFHTMWQLKANTWRERTLNMWDTLTLELFDWEVLATICADEKKRIHEAWKFFERLFE